MADAAKGHIQPPRLTAAALSRRRANQLGRDERRHRNRRDHLLPQARNRHRRHHQPGTRGDTAVRQRRGCA